MTTRDFIEDAMDSLENDPNNRYILVAAQPGTDTVSRATCVRSLEELEWFKKALWKLVLDLEEDLKEQEQL